MGNLANVGDLASAIEATSLGAEVAGLLRGEFLFMALSRPPVECLQALGYARILAAMTSWPFLIGPPDIGEDKPPLYLESPHKVNPSLGWLATRVNLGRSHLFTLKVRVILRATVGHGLQRLLLMVSRREEILGVRHLMLQAGESLTWDGLACAEGVRVGVMVQTPAAAVSVDVLAEVSGLFSLRRNGLTQCMLWVDSGNARIAPLFEPLHPVVLRAIRTSILAPRRAEGWFGRRAEPAGMRPGIRILLVLDLDEFRIVPTHIR